MEIKLISEVEPPNTSVDLFNFLMKYLSAALFILIVKVVVSTYLVLIEAITFLIISRGGLSLGSVAIILINRFMTSEYNSPI